MVSAWPWMMPSSTVHFSLPTSVQPVRSLPLNNCTQSSPGGFGRGSAAAAERKTRRRQHAPAPSTDTSLAHPRTSFRSTAASGLVSALAHMSDAVRAVVPIRCSECSAMSASACTAVDRRLRERQHEPPPLAPSGSPTGGAVRRWARRSCCARRASTPSACASRTPLIGAPARRSRLARRVGARVHHRHDDGLVPRRDAEPLSPQIRAGCPLRS